jgi:hypothetical protein
VQFTSAIYKLRRTAGQMPPTLVVIKAALPWWRGAVDIASSSGTRRPGFESRQGKVFGKHSSAVEYKYLNMHCLCIEKREIKALAKNVKKKKKKRHHFKQKSTIFSPFFRLKYF